MFTLTPTSFAGFSNPHARQPVAPSLSLPPRFAAKFAKEGTQTQSVDQFVWTSPILRNNTETKTKTAARPKTSNTPDTTTASRHPTPQFEKLQALINKPDEFVRSISNAPNQEALKEETDVHGNSLLHHVAAIGNLNLVQFLVVVQGFSPTLLNEDNHNPAAKAALNGHRAVTTYLIDNYRDCQMQADHSGKVPFNHLREFYRRRKGEKSSIDTATSPSTPAERPSRRRKSSSTTDSMPATRPQHSAQKISKSRPKASRKSTAKTKQTEPAKLESEHSPKAVAATSPDFMPLTYSPEQQAMGSPLEESEFSSWLLNEFNEHPFDTQMNSEPRSNSPITMDYEPMMHTIQHFRTDVPAVSPFLTARGKTGDPMLYQTENDARDFDPFNGLAPELFIHPKPQFME